MKQLPARTACMLLGIALLTFPARAPAGTIVRLGDTFGSVSERFHVPVRAVGLANRNEQLIDLLVWPRIEVPGHGMVWVHLGDTLESVASRYGVFVEDLVDAPTFASLELVEGAELMLPNHPPLPQGWWSELQRLLDTLELFASQLIDKALDALGPMFARVGGILAALAFFGWVLVLLTGVSVPRTGRYDP